MKILHVQGEHVSFGGAETYLRDLIRFQRGAGHAVSIVYGAERPAGEGTGPDEFFLGPSYGIRSGIAVWSRFRRALARIDPDVIHLHVTHYHLSPLIVHYLALKKPTVQTVHDTLAFCFKEPNAAVFTDWARILPTGAPCYHAAGCSCFATGCTRTFLGKAGPWKGSARVASVLWRRAAHRRIGRYLANSDFTRRDLVRNGFRPERIRVLIPQPSAPESWKRPRPADAPEDASVPMLLYAGKISTLKGLPLLVRALALLGDRPWRAVFAGDGPESPAIDALIREHGLADRVQRIRGVSREDMADYYRACRLVLFPSIWPEPFGLVGPEAMYFGKPVIGFDVGGVREWLSDGETGYLVQPGQVHELSRRIAALLADKTLYRRMSDRARIAASRFFDMESHASQVMAEYEASLDRWLRRPTNRHPIALCK